MLDRCPNLPQASVAGGHLAGLVELAQAPSHEQHGLDVAEHADELLLVDLERRQRGSELLPLHQVPAI